MLKGNVELLKNKSVTSAKDLFIVGTSEDVKSLEKALLTGEQSKDITILTTLPLSDFLSTVAYGVSDIIRLDSWNVTETQLQQKLNADKTFQKNALFYAIKEKAENQELTAVEVVNLIRLYVSTKDSFWFKCLTNARNYGKYIGVSAMLTDGNMSAPTVNNTLIENLRKAFDEEQEKSQKIISEKERQIKMLNEAIAVGSKEFDILEKKLADAEARAAKAVNIGPGMEADVAGLKAELEQKKAELEKANKELEACKLELAALKAESNELREKNAKLVEEHKQELETARKELENIKLENNDLATVKKELDEANEVIKSLKDQLEEVGTTGVPTEEVQDLKNKLAEAELQNQELQGKILELQSTQITVASADSEEFELRYAQLKEKYADTVTQLQLKEDEVDILKAKMKKLQDRLTSVNVNLEFGEDKPVETKVDAIKSHNVAATDTTEQEELQNQLVETQNKLASALEEVRDLKDKVDYSKTEVDALTDKYKLALQDKEDLKFVIEGLRKQVSDKEQELEEQAIASDAHENLLSEKKELETTIEELREQISALTRENIALAEENDAIKTITAIEKAEESGEANEDTSKALKESLDRIYELEKEKEELQSHIKSLDEKLEDILDPQKDSPEVKLLKETIRELEEALQQRENDYAALAPMLFEDRPSSDKKNLAVNDFDGILPVVMDKQALTAKNIITFKEVGCIPYLEDIIVYLTAKITIALKDYSIKPCVVILDPLTDKNRVERYKRMGVTINEEPKFNHTPVSMVGVTNTLSYIDLRQNYNLNSYKLIIFVDRYAGNQDYVKRADITRYSITPTADYLAQVRTDKEHTLLTYKEDGNINSIDIPASFIKGDDKTRMSYLTQMKAYSKVITDIIDSLVI